MKKMTCKQLAGACDLEFKAETFAEMAEMSKKHGMEMMMKQDSAHMEAMQKVMAMMQADPNAGQKMFARLEAEFDAQPMIDSV